MEKSENMSIIIRIKSTGNIKPKNIYIKLQDTLGKITLNEGEIFTVNPAFEYQEFYFNFNNNWRYITKGSTPLVVDLSAISGFDFYVELEVPLTDLRELKLEIDYIQLGNFVDWSFNTITGRVYTDNNGDCQFNVNDVVANQALVKAEPGPYYAYTDEKSDKQYIVLVQN